MILYYFVEFAGSFANIALLLLFIGRLFPKKEPVSKWFYVYVVLMIAGQCALSLFPDWVTQRTIYLLVGGFFLALLFYEVRPWQAVFASGAFFTLIALVEVLAMLLIGLRIPDTDILMQAGAARLVYVVFSNLIQVPLVVLISHFFSRKGNALRILWLLPIIAIQIASIAVCYVAQYHAADEYFPDYMVGLMAVLLLINILIVFYALMKSKIIGVCPNCGKPVVEREKGWFCENRECRFVLWKDNAFFKRLGKRLDAHVADKLLRDGRVRLKDCKSAKGKTYNATVLLSCEADGRSKFSLEFEGGC